MAGRGTVSVSQAPQYGNKTALDNVKKATTTTPMTGVPTPAPSAGRPPGSTAPQQGAAQAQPQKGVDPQHQQLMQSLAQAYRTKLFWDGVLAQSPSEWSRMYSADANKTYQRIAQQLRETTPFFAEG